MLPHVDLVKTDFSEQCITSISSVTRIGQLGTTLTATSNRITLQRNTVCSVLRLLVNANVVTRLPIHVTLMMEVIRSSETSVLTSTTLRNIPEDSLLQSHRREHLKSSIALTDWTL
jgi:hypothetical protein